MNPITIYLLEASICLGVFYLFYLAVLQRQPSFRYNRAYLLLTSALGWILPLLEVPVGFGSSSATTGGSTGYFLLSPTEVGGAESAAGGNFSGLVVIYGLGVVAMLIYFTRQFFRLYQVIQGSQPQSVPHHRYRLLYTQGKFPTASFFRYLFWDNTQSLTVAETHQMMQHEEAHIQQGHSYDTLYMMLLKTFAWFHPLVYLYDRALTQNHEYAADAAVLQQTSTATYARLLSKRMLAAQNVLPVHYFFYSSQILNRIHMIYSRTHRTPWYKYVLIVPVFASLFFTFSCQEESELSRLDELSEQYQEAETQEEKSTLSDADEVFMVVEEQPTPEGGMESFYKYISKNLKYPTEARQKGIEGKVFVQFVVDKDGALTDVKALKGIGHGCDEEAVRVIQESPAWNPGQQRGKIVRVRMVMPITYRLGEKEPRAEVNGLENAQGEMRVRISRQDNVVKGSVTDEEGNPLKGANVIVKGTTQGTVVNAAGKFALRLNDSESESVAVVSFVGYQSQQVKL